MTKGKKKVRRLCALLVIAALVMQQIPFEPVRAAEEGNVWSGTVAPSYEGGDGTQDNPYLIADGAQLARLANEVNAGNETGNYYQLTNDINLGGVDWTPIGNADTPFSGYFDGMGHVISNMYISGSASVSRLQGKPMDSESVSANDILDSGSVSANDILDSESVQEDTGDGNADNTDNTDNTDNKTADSMAAPDDLTEPGALPERSVFKEYAAVSSLDEVLQTEMEAIIAEVEAAAEAEEAVDEYSDADTIAHIEEDIERIEEQTEAQQPGQFQNENHRAGYSALQETVFDYVGLFGYMSAGSIVNTGIAESDIYGGIRTGGIVGYSAAGTEIENCYYMGTIDSNRSGALGGIAGYADGEISYCYNKGTLGGPYSNITYLGGIAGVATDYILNCNNSGEVSGNRSYTGGIVGFYNTNKMIKTCFNSGNIGTAEGNSTFIGGIAGYAKNGIIGYCANHGTVTGSSVSGFQGGLAGSINIMALSYNTGNVSGYYSAGLSGAIYGGSLRNYNAGTITGIQNAGITGLLAANATVSDTTYWRSNSASRAIYSRINTSSGTPIAVLEYIMKSDTWIQNTLKAPFAPDISGYNQGYPVHSEIDYNFSYRKGEIIEGTFYFSSRRTEEKSPGQLGEDYAAKYYYSDEYFLQGASVYNQSLATMSLCLEMSAFGSNAAAGEDNPYAEKYKNAEQLLREIGFQDIDANDDYKKRPEQDTFGVIVAHKEIDIRGNKKTVIALATRGGGYEAEWGANFKVGASGHHDGFEEAGEKAYGFLKTYIEDHREEFQNEVILWLTGYSRAAAATNLLAGKLTADGQIGGVTFGARDVYAYCFATPMGRLTTDPDQRSYANIHNIINPSDLVTKVAPAYWDFGRYGVDEPVIPGSLTVDNQEYYDKMILKFGELGTEWVEESLTGPVNNKIHVLNTFQSKKLNILEEDENGEIQVSFTVEDDDRTMSEFLDSLIRIIAIGAGDRETYAEQLQGAISTVVAETLGGGADADKWKKAPEYIGAVLQERVSDIILTYLFVGYEEAEALAYQCICDGILEAGIDIYSPHYESLSPTTFSAALDTMLGVVMASLIANGFDDFVTLSENSNGLITAHYPELYFAWLQIQDPNYKGEPIFFASTYRTVRINSAVDVTVYDSAGTLVAQFIGDEPQEIGSSAPAASLNGKGEKVLHLPSDEAYDIRMVATADGTLDYSIGENSYYTGAQTKLVNYYDIPVTAGDIIEGIIPEFQPEDTLVTGEGSDVDYMLINAAGDVAPSRELQDQEAQEAFHIITPVSGNPEGGNVIGGGVYSEGAYTLICAVAYENYEFAGWYEDDKLVSTESIYEFRVEQDTVIT